MPTFKRLTSELREKAYATVPFPVSRAQFTRAIDIFFAFLALPLEVKEALYFKIRPDDRGSEVGYKRYRREEGKTDNREYVHYHRLAEERFDRERKDVPQFDALLSIMKQIHDEAASSLEKIMRTFEPQYPGIHQKFFSPENPGNFYLRFLKYDRAEPGEFLAKGHYDRGTCTLALSESAPGLRMGTTDADVREVVHKDGEALFMLAFKFHEITSEEFVPTWHDVIQKSEDAYNDETARWAIVFFADANDVPSITYDEAHTPKTR